MAMNKRRIVIWLWLLISLALWVFDFRFIGFLLFVIGWFSLIGNEATVGKMIRKTVIAGFFFIIFWIVSQFRIFELTTNFAQPCWSPDGKQIAFFMHKHLERRRPGMMGWIGTNIWDKYYLCTMDYDGGNFKAVRETKHLGRVMWPGNGNIIFSEEKHSSFMENGKYKDKINAAAYQIHPDGSGLEELWHWNERSEYQDVLWLTPDSEYLVVAKNTDVGRTYGIYDRGESKIKKELQYQGKFSGSYEDNKIAIDDFNHLMIINLDTLTTKIFDSKGKNTFEKLLTGFEYGALSPDRSMYTREGGVWTVGNKKVVADFSVKPKRSYLFNIFWK